MENVAFYKFTSAKIAGQTVDPAGAQATLGGGNNLFGQDNTSVVRITQTTFDSIHVLSQRVMRCTR